MYGYILWWKTSRTNFDFHEENKVESTAMPCQPFGKTKMNKGFFLFDWRDQEAGMGVSFELNDGSTASCFLAHGDSPYNPWNWNVDEAQNRYGLSEAECVDLRERLGRIMMDIIPLRIKLGVR
jgi:hypothetical protein